MSRQNTTRARSLLLAVEPSPPSDIRLAQADMEKAYQAYVAAIGCLVMILILPCLGGTGRP